MPLVRGGTRGGGVEMGLHPPTPPHALPPTQVCTNCRCLSRIPGPRESIAEAVGVSPMDPPPPWCSVGFGALSEELGPWGGGSLHFPPPPPPHLSLLCY